MRINFTEVGARLRVELLLTKRSKSSLSNIILKSGVAPNTLKCTEINTNKTFVIETSVITKAINKGVSSRQMITYATWMQRVDQCLADIDTFQQYLKHTLYCLL